VVGVGEMGIPKGGKHRDATVTEKLGAPGGAPVRSEKERTKHGPVNGKNIENALIDKQAVVP